MNRLFKTISDIAKRPNEALEAAAGKNRIYYYAVKLAVFLRITATEYMQNHCTSRASGIAFVLLITLIPLIATAAAIVANTIAEFTPQHIERAVAAVLPFAPPAVMDYILEFFQNARGITGIGFAILIVIAMGLFNIVEQSLNSIWKVARSRSFFTRLRTFTMVLVYSPVLFFASFQLRRSGIFGLLPQDVFLMRIPPIIFTALAFSVMFRFIPNMRVRAASAILGGVISCALFELERWGFGYYVNLSIQTQTIYGAFGLLVFFLLSLYFSALLFLIGAQAAYVHQNFRPLLRSARSWDRRVGDYRSYIAMRMTIDCVRAFLKKEPPPTQDHFCDKYELTLPQATGILNWLVHEKFVHQVNGPHKFFVPARDFSQDTVSEVFSAIESQYHKIPVNPQDKTKEYLAAFMDEYESIGCAGEGSVTIGELIETLYGDEGDGGTVLKLAPR